MPYTARENAVVLPYADNPLDDEATGENVYLNMIRSAKDYVYITTPYLILSDEMQRTLRLPRPAALMCGSSRRASRTKS